MLARRLDARVDGAGSASGDAGGGMVVMLTVGGAGEFD